MGKHKLHPQISIHKQKYVKLLTDFAQCICPRSSQQDVEKVLQAIAQNKLGYGKMKQVAQELEMTQPIFNQILYRLRNLGILTKDWHFSKIFQDKLTAISEMYAEISGMESQHQKLLREANQFLKSKDFGIEFKPIYKEEEK